SRFLWHRYDASSLSLCPSPSLSLPLSLCPSPTVLLPLSHSLSLSSSPSLCPSPFNCITRNIKRHLPYSTFFSSIFLSLSLYFLSHHLSASLHFLSFFQIGR